MIIVREPSKARHRYFTFSTISVTSQLLSYLNDILVHGESLNADSPVVAPDHIYKTRRGNNYNKPFLPTRQISKRIREVFKSRFN
ncbi:MAG: hypothetical protein R1F52_06495 [Candidatus Nitrosoabyssus spongiisocia]|nr:MAG: hypothetical protein R1F52_06495 [Nitrosopumilaceae archaeon AB1(1)]